MIRLFKGKIRIDAARLVDADELSDIHGLAFHRGWDAAELEALLSQPEVLALAARRSGAFIRSAVVGFLITRAAADEAEVLTLVVHPSRRGLGLGRRLMEEGLRRLYAQGIRSVFLEVEEGNAAAVALYGKLGFRKVGSRPRYYAQGGEPAAEALVFRIDLG
jgi:ribosomal-protein-alanine N-acetyltransferase